MHSARKGAPADWDGLGFVPGDETALALIHETGHLLGLPHSSDDRTTPFDDGLDDTPACTAAKMAEDLNGCPDVNNVMFPFTQSPVGKTAFSAHQKALLQATTFYRPFAPPK